MNEKVKISIDYFKEKGYIMLSDDSRHYYFWMGKVSESRADLVKIDSKNGEREIINIPKDIFNNFITLI